MGLIYFGARYYSPNLGRFISPDPLTIHGLGGSPNPYEYAHGSPMRYVDPFGLDDPPPVEGSDPGFDYVIVTGEPFPVGLGNGVDTVSDAPGGLASDFEPGGVLSDSGTDSSAQKFLALADAESAAFAAAFNTGLDAAEGVASLYELGVTMTGSSYKDFCNSAWNIQDAAYRLDPPNSRTGQVTYAVASIGIAAALPFGPAEMAAIRGFSAAAEGFELAEGAAQGAGFSSFKAFKNVVGRAGEGRQWHHIVEQTPSNLARFGSGPIQNTGNLIRLDTGVHQQISGFYSSIQPFTGGATVRQWLGTQPFAIQQQFGEEVLLRFGVSF